MKRRIFRSRQQPSRPSTGVIARCVVLALLLCYSFLVDDPSLIRVVVQHYILAP